MGHLAEWSGGSAVEPDVRLESCFDTRVFYFDKMMTWPEIAADSRQYNARFDQRSFRMDKIVPPKTLVNGDVTVRYQLHVDSLPKANHALKVNDLTMEATLRRSAGRWKIVSLRTVTAPRKP